MHCFLTHRFSTAMSKYVLLAELPQAIRSGSRNARLNITSDHDIMQRLDAYPRFEFIHIKQHMVVQLVLGSFRFAVDKKFGFFKFFSMRNWRHSNVSAETAENRALLVLVIHQTSLVDVRADVLAHACFFDCTLKVSIQIFSRHFEFCFQLRNAITTKVLDCDSQVLFSNFRISEEVLILFGHGPIIFFDVTRFFVHDRNDFSVLESAGNRHIVYS